MAESTLAPESDSQATPVLRLDAVSRQYQVRGRTVHAVSSVSLDVWPGETVGLVGESGCGKSTLARAIMQLPPPTSGRILFDGVDLCGLRGAELRAKRPHLQMVFQDPISSLNPRRRIAEIVSMPLVLHTTMTAAQRDAATRAMLAAVGLEPDAVWSAKAHELSGGQCQRVSLARALILEPRMLVCDEAVSSLDVSVQAQILNQLEDMKDRFRLSMLFIAHDLAVVKNISDRIAVMYLGRLCEVGPAQSLYDRPRHPYTRALIDAIPRIDPAARHGTRKTIEGDPPSPFDPPSGCRFRTRCPRADATCARQTPELIMVGPQHAVACHHPLQSG